MAGSELHMTNFDRLACHHSAITIATETIIIPLRLIAMATDMDNARRVSALGRAFSVINHLVTFIGGSIHFTALSSNIDSLFSTYLRCNTEMISMVLILAKNSCNIAKKLSLSCILCKLDNTVCVEKFLMSILTLGTCSVLFYCTI